MTVQTMRAPAGTSPASCVASRPATEAAEPGSTKTPSWDERKRCASRICSSVTASMRPPDSSRAASACVHEAGLPMRIAVAMVSGSSTGCPSTSGAAPAAWKPHILGGCVAGPGCAESCWYSR